MTISAAYSEVILNFMRQIWRVEWLLKSNMGPWATEMLGVSRWTRGTGVSVGTCPGM